MAGPDESYDPAQFARGIVKGGVRINGSLEDADDNSVGLRPERNPTATLRLFGTSIGNQWLMYGGVNGGLQDYQPAGEEEEKAGCDWFTLYYKGILLWEGREVFSFWKVTVRGSGLEPICHQVGKQTRSTLRIGSTDNSVVESIVIEPFQPAVLSPDDDDD